MIQSYCAYQSQTCWNEMKWSTAFFLLKLCFPFVRQIGCARSILSALLAGKGRMWKKSPGKKEKTSCLTSIPQEALLNIKHTHTNTLALPSPAHHPTTPTSAIHCRSVPQALSLKQHTVVRYDKKQHARSETTRMKNSCLFVCSITGLVYSCPRGTELKVGTIRHANWDCLESNTALTKCLFFSFALNYIQDCINLNCHWLFVEFILNFVVI